MTGEQKREYLTGRFGPTVRFDEPMSLHTSMRVGGAAKIFATPENVEDLKEILHWAGTNGVDYYILGGGTNIVVKESGIDALVISLVKCMNRLEKTGEKEGKTFVLAGAGVKVSSVCAFASKNGLDGMQFALGIPGLVGGGVMMNAGTALGEMGDAIDWVKLLTPEGRIHRISRKDIKFEYRKFIPGGPCFEKPNGSPGKKPIILEACFCLKTSGKENATRKEETLSILKRRKQSQPVGALSAGCIFKNPEKEKPAGMLIEEAGLKGATLGQARVSEKHANFIVNKGKASANDILGLINLVREKVYEKNRIHLETEVEIVG